MNIMEIDAPSGTKVVFLDENGFDMDREHAREHMNKGDVLTVAHTDTGGWRTDVMFEEIPGKWFNSVMFGVEDNG